MMSHAVSPASRLHEPPSYTPHVGEYNLQRRKQYTDESWTSLIHKLETSTTLYVGNVSFYTTEGQVAELMQRVGTVRRVIMGLNKLTLTPCGFCFVEFYSHAHALAGQQFLSQTKLDGRFVRAEMDAGFEEGRQFGRGKTGGQLRDDYRLEFDAGRGGWGSSLAAGGGDGDGDGKGKSMYASKTPAGTPARKRRRGGDDDESCDNSDSDSDDDDSMHGSSSDDGGSRSDSETQRKRRRLRRGGDSSDDE
jgi:nuclear cap-binding protein subunit 2